MSTRRPPVHTQQESDFLEWLEDRPRRSTGSGLAALAATAVVSSAVAIIFSKNFLETEKRITQRITTDYGVADGPFVRTMSHLLGPPLVPGNKVTVLHNGAEIFPRMLQAIRGARHTVTFENFVLIKGRIMRAFMEALAERASAGVKVHFLQDGMGSDCLDSPEIQALRAAGAEVEIFRRYNLTHFNHRTHRKLLVIDGSKGYVGGVGISDQWDGHGNKPGHWRDTQYEVEGPVVAQMQEAFLDNWMQTRGCVLHGDDYFPALKECGDKLCQIFKSSVSEGADNARLMFLISIAAARHSIRIVNPYFVPDRQVIGLLKAACKRDVSVEIIAPSDRIDQRVVRFVGRARWGGLLKAGVRFFEFQPALLHSKYFIVDGQWASVGSCNLDDRSLCLNEEANLNIWDKEFAREHLEVFEDDKSKSREITWATWRRRPMKEKFLGHLAGVFRSQL